MTGRLIPNMQLSTHPSFRLGNKSKNLKNAAVPPLRVFAAAMNRTTQIHLSPINRKWVKALELVDSLFPKSQGIDET
jgi:hypothetical protein